MSLSATEANTICPSHPSATDDPPSLRDAVRQLLLRGQPACDAQQGRLLLQWGDLGLSLIVQRTDGHTL